MPTGVAETEMPTPSFTPAPALRPTLSPTSVPEPEPTPEPTLPPVLSLETTSFASRLNDNEWLTRARDCVKQAQIVMAPFMSSAPPKGASVSDREGQTWKKLESYTTSAQLNNALLEVFSVEIVEDILASVSPFLWERADGLYLREDAGRALNWDYTVDFEYMGPQIILGVFGVFGTAFGRDTDWQFRLYVNEKSTIITSWRALEWNYGVQLGDVWYSSASNGSPPGLGEPLATEKEEGLGWGDSEPYIEYYDGLTVKLWRPNFSGDDDNYHPVYISITKPGFSVSSGIEVGDTWEKVVSRYPAVPRRGEPGPKRSWNISNGWDSGDCMAFIFDDAGILTEINIVYTLN